jgi:hypothetical protein
MAGAALIALVVSLDDRGRGWAGDRDDHNRCEDHEVHDRPSARALP